MTARLRSADLFCFDGQSLANQPVGNNYPLFVAAAFPGHVHRVVAEGGSAWNQRVLNAHDIDARFLGSVTGLKILIDTPGQTDINLFPDVASIEAEAEAYWEARRAAGWDLIVSTTVPMSVNFEALRGGVGPNELQMRDDLNDFIEASVDPGVMLDAFIDWRLDPELEEVDGAAFSDGTHPTAATAENIMAPRAISVLSALLA